MKYQLNKRHQNILSLLQDSPVWSINELAEKLQVTPQTIRSDIKVLDKKKFIKRFHGGITSASSSVNNPYSERGQFKRSQKHKIGQCIAGLIPDESSIFINVGTTTEATARCLENHSNLQIITNNLNVALICASNSKNRVFTPSGEIREDGAILGGDAERYFNQFSADFAIIGISSINQDGNLLDYDVREATSAKHIIANANHVILATDISKLNRRAMVKVGTLQDINTIVLDETPNAQWMRLFAENQVEVIIANTS